MATATLRVQRRTRRRALRHYMRHGHMPWRPRIFVGRARVFFAPVGAELPVGTPGGDWQEISGVRTISIR